MFKLIMALIGVMLANILLGASLARIKEEYNQDTFLNGVFKAGCIILGFLFMLASSMLTEDIAVVTINGIDLNLFDAMKTIVVAGIVLYSSKDLIKLAELFKIKTKIEAKNGQPDDKTFD